MTTPPAASVRSALALHLALVFLSTNAAAVELHVAPAGNDANPGTADRPLASLEGARNAIRQLKAHGPLAEAVTVTIADGTYTLTAPLVLEPGDGGTAAAPIVYQAAAGARPIFSGGRALSGWQPGEGGLWKLHIPEVAQGHWYFEQLFINGRRAARARSPNKFYFYIQNLRETPLDPTKKGPNAPAQQTVRMRADDFQQTLAKVRPDELRDVHLVVYHNWDNTRRFVDSIDPAQNSLSTHGQAMKPWNPWRRNSTFVLENFRAALDSPGEWFLSRDGTLYYMPLPGEDLARAETVAPVLEKFVILAGQPAAGKFVEHVTFRGLAFRHGQWLTPPGGFEPAQAAAPIEAVIMADGARHVTLADCEVGHVGTYCVWFRKGCRDCSLVRSFLHDFGAGGVRIGEIGIARNENERTGHNQVDNNILVHGGQIFPCAEGVWIGQSPDNAVTHNEIADMFHIGISAGWCWGYKENLTKRNTIAFNHVHHLGWGPLSDLGGIYTLGPSEGTVVRNNVFHDIYSYSYGGWGLYTDEGSTGVTFENNLVYRTKTGSFHQHYGKENLLRNNILALSKEQQLQATRAEDHLSFTLENNIVYWDSGRVLAGPWEKVQFVSRNNVFWQAPGQKAQPEAIDFAGHTLADWQAKGHEQGSVIADPKLANPSHGDFRAGDFRLAADSPAIKLGFKPFDPAQAGVYGDAAWLAKAGAETYPPLEVAPSPPPLEINDDFEDQAVGRQPGGARSHVENRGDSIAVTDDTAATGRHSVKFTDAPGLKQSFNPHLTYEDLGYTAGRVRNSFDLRIEKDSQIGIEWRDYSSGQYCSGAQLAVRNGKLTVGKTVTLPLPPQQWIHIELASNLDAPNPTWTLSVSLPNQPPRQYRNLPWTSPQFKHLTWIGFSSTATYKTVFYLDNFVLGPDKTQ